MEAMTKNYALMQMKQKKLILFYNLVITGMTSRSAMTPTNVTGN